MHTSRHRWLTTATTHDPESAPGRRWLPPALAGAYAALWAGTAVGPGRPRRAGCSRTRCRSRSSRCSRACTDAGISPTPRICASAAFLTLHTVGAHYTLSGRAARRVAARRVRGRGLGARAIRTTGSCTSPSACSLVYPLRELLQHHVWRRRAATVLAVGAVLALSAVYEVLEWGAARWSRRPRRRGSSARRATRGTRSRTWRSPGWAACSARSAGRPARAARAAARPCARRVRARGDGCGEAWCASACAGWSLPRAEQPRFPAEGTHLRALCAGAERGRDQLVVLPPAPRDHLREVGGERARAVPLRGEGPADHHARAAARGCRALLDAFLGEATGLGERLGCLLVQLPPSLDIRRATARTRSSARCARGTRARWRSSRGTPPGSRPRPTRCSLSSAWRAWPPTRRACPAAALPRRLAAGSCTTGCTDRRASTTRATTRRVLAALARRRCRRAAAGGRASGASSTTPRSAPRRRTRWTWTRRWTADAAKCRNETKWSAGGG